ncbi:MAG TPA: hypothetical protein VFA01_06095 [Candidatus Dormibacteraeota bacterium]|nr:hypothetical protein [Candidatus Dormibacteraeota bacterium]
MLVHRLTRDGFFAYDLAFGDDVVVTMLVCHFPKLRRSLSKQEGSIFRARHAG